MNPSRRSVDGGHIPSYTHEPKRSPNLEEHTWNVPPQTNGGDSKRNTARSLDHDKRDENSAWIHRDKLARIESEELQAAGIYIPRTRAPSKQRRDRSRSAMRRGAESTEPGNNRSRKNSNAVVEPRNAEPRNTEPRNSELALESWDLRTPEEIAEEEANAYFATNTHKGGSRIPVAKKSPAPIHMEHLDRTRPTSRDQSDSPDRDSLYYQKTRPRSASMKSPDAIASGITGAKRSVTDVSPKKNSTAPRKTSASSRPPTSGGRPKTRSGSNKDSNGNTATRPSTRSGDFSQGSRAPEGDPPWMINSYKPDPRLPPDQQILPTVARRLQQEKWEKEGKFGDVYDKDFRPLNENVFLKPSEPENNTAEEEENRQLVDEWPLKEPARNPNPTLRVGSSYSTMPKISDKPQMSPLPSPRTPITPATPAIIQQPQSVSRVEAKAPERPPPLAEDDNKGSCGCCVVM